MRKLIAAPIAAACMAWLPLAGCAEQDKPEHTQAEAGMQMTETIDVASRDGRVLVTLRFANPTARTLHVPAAVAEDDEPAGPLFALRTADGTPVPYIGMMVKRGPLTAADYRALAPHAGLVNVIDITRSYAFRPGRHAYTLSHDARYLADPARPETTTSAGTVSATFSHTQ